MKVKTIRHTGLVVLDLDTAKKFFVDELGMEVYSEELEVGPFIETILGMRDCRVVTCKMRPRGDSGSALELLCFENPFNETSVPQVRLNQNGLTHLALEVEGIDLLVSSIQKNWGFHLISPPTLSPGGKAKVCFIQTSFGTLLELVELPRG